MSGLQVNHRELANTGAKTADKAKEADGIQQKLGAANGLIPEKAWGLLGNLTVHHMYTDMLGAFQDHVSNMVQGMEKLADDIRSTADHYRQNDEAAEEKFKDIEKELG